MLHDYLMATRSPLRSPSNFPRPKHLARVKWVLAVAVASLGTGLALWWWFQDGVKPLIGHTNNIVCVAFSPDGARAVSAAYDGTVRVWDLRRRQEFRRLERHAALVHAAIFSPDGRQVLSGGASNRLFTSKKDFTVRLWDVESGRELRRFEGHQDSVLALAFLPEQRQILSASKDQTARLWNIDSGQEVRRVALGGSDILCLALSGDGRYLVGGSSDNRVRLWNLAEGREVRRFDGHTNWVAGVAVYPQGRRVLSLSLDKTVRLWDMDSGRELLRLDGRIGEGRCVAFSPDGRRALTGHAGSALIGHAGSAPAGAEPDFSVRLWDLDRGQELATFQGHKDYVFSVAFSPDGRTGISASADMTLRLWRLPK